MSLPRCCCFMALVSVTALASGILPPRNVRLTSHNMDLYLRWKPPENVSGQILYSTKLHVGFDRDLVRPACVNTSALLCELSDPDLGLNIMEFGEYNASVRVLSENEASDWVYSLPLTMDRDTVIGPPTVALVSMGAGIEVTVTAPEFKVSSIARVFGHVKYNVSYWPRGRAQQASHVLVQQNRVVLSGMEPWTEYCVQVQIQVDSGRNRHPAEASELVCESTAGVPSAPWVTAVPLFGALVLTVALVVVAVVYHKAICHLLCTKDSTPMPLQDLRECPHSPLFVPEERCNPFTMTPCHDEGELLPADTRPLRPEL
ncbi:interleukin-10 receptor subunit beta-like [Eucyclogobius newberryi]|uniref:interleukin-10 receptor subunit beta-like n=1 Tax=Eucyclogobius newberryi TaxID=166745 RepID=UPI003B5B43E4